MTIDTDLATLRDELAWQLDYGNRASEHLQDFEEALDRVEAEVARLTVIEQAARELTTMDGQNWLPRFEKLRALLAEDEAVRGEYHAEGLDERGIYGGKSHEPIEERPVDRRHPDYADDPWLAEDTPKGGAA